MLTIVSTGCENTFEPIGPGGPPFSIFGYLDVSADTQWIRVNALRSTLLASDETTGTIVTLENLGTGEVIQLRDSVMSFVNMIGTEPVYAHTFWTTLPIEPGASYRFRAQGRDGAVAESIVQMPRDYDLEVWVSQYLRGFTYIRAEGLKQVPFVFWNTYYYDGCHIPRFFRHIQYVAPGGDSVAQMILKPDYGGDIPVCDLSGFTITRQDVDMVGSEVPWPYDQDYSTWRLLPDSAASNVTGALGFLGGVLTKKTRAEDCVLPGPSSPETYCKLRYDSTTATLGGTLASTCVVPPDSVDIELRELAPPPGERPRTRFGIVDPADSYDIGALRPGIPHQLTIAVGDTTGRFHPRFFEVVYDTLQFTAGQVAAHHATLEPIGPCPRL